MGDRMAASEKTKAQFVADVLNRTFMNLVTWCTKSDGLRDYFDIGVIGYGGATAQNPLAGQLLNPISALEANPLRVGLSRSFS